MRFYYIYPIAVYSAAFERRHCAWTKPEEIPTLAVSSWLAGLLRQRNCGEKTGYKNVQKSKSLQLLPDSFDNNSLSM
jgi:hypothetical protein